MIRPGVPAVALILLVLAGLPARVVQAAETGSDRQYQIRGIVRQGPDDRGQIVVEHEDVPGLMPAMTMPFQVKDPAEAADLKPGDGVVFTLTLGDAGASIAQIRRIDPASVKLPAPPPPREEASAPVRRVKEGDTWPEFALMDAEGKQLKSADLAGCHVLLNFIFTRCAVPDYCPLMTRNFSEISSALAADTAAGKVRLLSVSFDPQDTPDVLRQYAEAKSAPWTFATGEPGEIDKLTRAFAVRIEQEGGTYNHGLCTALVAPDGRILQLWRGNAWKPQEVTEAVRTALGTTQN